MEKRKNQQLILSYVGLNTHKKYGAVQAAKQALSKHKFTSKGPLHQQYKRNFNFVDLLNKRWYSVEDRHGHKWETKFALTLVRFATINAWTISKKETGKEWIDWRFELAKNLMNSSPDDSDH